MFALAVWLPVFFSFFPIYWSIPFGGFNCNLPVFAAPGFVDFFEVPASSFVVVYV
jgi:hypothetical protein